MHKVLVTGGLGFIGSHTCVTLLENDFKIIIVDNLSNSTLKVLEQIKKIVGQEKGNFINFYKGDIKNNEFLESIFYKELEDKFNIQSVIHFAGLKSVSESVRDPLKYWDNNVGGSINLLKVMAKYNCYNFVFSSSATIYGDYGLDPIPEDAQIKPTNPYGQTKYTVEKILENIYTSNPKKWKIANLRYFNPVGAHYTGFIGEEPKGIPNNLLPIIIKVATKEQHLLKVFGDNWPTYDGTCIRDYIHVMDLAEGHISALLNLMNNESKIINLNLGTGIGTSVIDLIKIFEKVNCCQLPFEITERRDGDVASLVADPQKANKFLDWYPKRTLEQVCIDSYNWIKLKNKIF
tara:strand:- start:282 stop:1325 length:1044 start_codon:yes stop_codon:yes gene_type:complete